MQTNSHFDTLLDSRRAELIESVTQSIRFPSVKADAVPGAPFGPELLRCLTWYLDLCERLGFRVKNLDGYCGYAEMGQGNEIVGILVHLDVVPAGAGWTVDPFGGQLRDGFIYGRGTEDDKGPALAAVYAAKAVMDSGLALTKRVRIIFGCDEENLWECIDHYKAAGEEFPVCGFSPDASFPVTHAEKGVLFADFLARYQHSGVTVSILELHGGSKPNMVPDSCEAVLDVPQALSGQVEHWAASRFPGAVWEGRRLCVRSVGQSAHGGMPEKGRNAISLMMEALGELDCIEQSQADFIAFYNRYIAFDLAGKRLCGEMRDDASGWLVLNSGVITWADGNIRLKTNLRYPVTVKGDDVIGRMRERAVAAGMELEVILDSAPLYVPKDDPLVVTLMNIYHARKDDGSEPLVISGGTFARAIPRAVAFGARFPDREELAHCADERVSEEDLLLSAKIFAEAIYALAKA